MTEGPFTDEMVRHYFKSIETQRGIAEAIEQMAHTLVEAGWASLEVTGDSPRVAINKWLGVLEQRASDILNQKRRELKELQAPTIEVDKNETG